MKEALNIVLFDGSLKTTPFINRLAKGLAKKHRVNIIGFNTSLQYPLKGVHYIALGSSEKSLNLFLVSIKLALQLLLKNYNLRHFFKTFKHIVTNDKIVLKQTNFNITLELISADILHIQWPSLMPWCEQAIKNPKIKTILSQRGFQNNVRPFVDSDNFEYLRKVYPKIDGFHSVSKAIAKVGDKVYDSKEKIDRVVYTGIDFSALPFSKDYEHKKIMRIVSVGRPHWKKGYEYAIHSIGILKSMGKTLEYIIVGAEGNEELTFLINDLDLNNEIKLWPKVSQKLAYQFIQEADVFLLPSIEEGIANVVVEAMAFGTPVISTDCGGMSELINNDQTGWLVPKRDLNAMAAAILNFSNLPIEKIESIQIEARKKVELQHNEEQMLLGMEGLYYEVLERH